jgi:hypothetical protein
MPNDSAQFSHDSAFIGRLRWKRLGLGPVNLIRSTVRVPWIAIKVSVLIAICFALFRMMDAMSKGVTWPHLPLAAWIGLIGTIAFTIQFIGMWNYPELERSMGAGNRNGRLHFRGS